MSVTELHLLPDDLGPAVDPLVVDSLVVDSLADSLVGDSLTAEALVPLAAEHQHTPSIAVLILNRAPDPTEVSQLYEDFEIVLIAHDAASAVRILEGMAPSAPVLPTPVTLAPVTLAPVTLAPVTLAPFTLAPVTLAPVVAVTSLFDDAGAERPRPAHGEHQLGLTLDEVHHLASWQGRSLPLTPRERAILGCLLGDPGRVWSYRDLFEHVWGGYYLGDPSLVHSALKRVRRKIRDAGVALTIDAVRGVGFRAQPDC